MLDRSYPRVRVRLPGTTLAILILSGLCAAGLARAQTNPPNPILFVTQVPVPADFTTIGSVFGNHRGDTQAVARGGDLWIRYPDGSLRNLTEEAGFGNSGFQGANAIAVRDPSVHFSGQKAVFSMLVGAPTTQYQQSRWYWQLYEVTGLGQGQNVAISRVPGQDANYNNVEPAYLSDGSLVFVSDRPRNGAAHLYPQLDEYESAPTNTGLWKLDTDGRLSLLQHAPSGSFGPILDSFGRILFTRWDHLQTDQQALADAEDEAAGTLTPGARTFDYLNESANSPRALRAPELFPEPLVEVPGSNINGHRFNFFFPWQMAQDGSAEETLNHIGRHELHSYFNLSFSNDGSLVEFISAATNRTNPNPVENLLQLAEDPTTPGRYYAIDAPEFGTHASGQLVSIQGAPSINPDDQVIVYHAPRSAAITYVSMPAGFPGRYRDPLPLSNGAVVAVWANQWRYVDNLGTRAAPLSNYAFRLQRLQLGAGTAQPVQALTGSAGITKSVWHWDPDVQVSYNGPLWELSPVEVVARAVPPATAEAALESPEAAVFANVGVNPAQFRAYLKRHDLGVLTIRNATTRDDADKQQPWNLRVPGGVQTAPVTSALLDIVWMQFQQADQIRGHGGMSDPAAGRRVLAKPLHDPAALAAMPPAPNGAPAGAVKIANDGSVAAMVPAQRALSWQSTTASGIPVVRERYWINVKPGEIRACAGCHGVNKVDQAGNPPAQNQPLALRDLLIWWRDNVDEIFFDTFEE